jgi:hypothetical protein
MLRMESSKTQEEKFEKVEEIMNDVGISLEKKIIFKYSN